MAALRGGACTPAGGRVSHGPVVRGRGVRGFPSEPRVPEPRTATEACPPPAHLTECFPCPHVFTVSVVGRGCVFKLSAHSSLDPKEALWSRGPGAEAESRGADSHPGGLAWCPAPAPSTPSSTHDVFEEVDYRVLILGPAVLRLRGQGAVVGGSGCVVCVLKDRVWTPQDRPRLLSRPDAVPDPSVHPDHSESGLHAAPPDVPARGGSGGQRGTRAGPPAVGVSELGALPASESTQVPRAIFQRAVSYVLNHRSIVFF